MDSDGLLRPEPDLEVDWTVSTGGYKI